MAIVDDNGLFQWTNYVLVYRQDQPTPTDIPGTIETKLASFCSMGMFNGAVSATNQNPPTNLNGVNDQRFVSDDRVDKTFQLK